MREIENCVFYVVLATCFIVFMTKVSSCVMHEHELKLEALKYPHKLEYIQKTTRESQGAQ